MTEIDPAFDTNLDVIFGEYKDQVAVSNFVSAARSAGLRGTLYIGYPVLTVDDKKIEYDALLVSRDRGVVVFDLYSLGAHQSLEVNEDLELHQERLYAALYNRLNSFAELRRGRNLIVDIVTASVHPFKSGFERKGESVIVGLDSLSKLPVVDSDRLLDDDQIGHLNAAIQRISNLKPKKRRLNVKSPDSKGAIIK